MHVEPIRSAEGFAGARSVWDQIHAADPKATVFLSWPWLAGLREGTHQEWLILACKPEPQADPVAFLPLRYSRAKCLRIPLIRELHMAGTPWADYTGLLCLPEYEDQAISALAGHLRTELQWDRLDFHDVLDPRCDLITERVSGGSVVTEAEETTPCPIIRLPDNWETYTREHLGRNMRRDVRRTLKAIEQLDAFRIVHASEGNLEQHIDILERLWYERWGSRSGITLVSLRGIFRECFASDMLYLVTIWTGDTPIAAMAGFTDRRTLTFSHYLDGWDDRFARYSPGTAVVAFAIRYALENGFVIYDFLRGNLDYR